MRLLWYLFVFRIRRISGSDKRLYNQLSGVKGYDPAFGARPMARVVEEHIKKPLAEEMLFGKLQKGGTAVVKRKGEGLEIVAKAR